MICQVSTLVQQFFKNPDNFLIQPLHKDDISKLVLCIIK
jgi:hypothetical protein